LKLRVSFEINSNEDPSAILESVQEFVAEAFGYDEDAEQSASVEEV
jgi:hypothetical protein